MRLPPFSFFEIILKLDSFAWTPWTNPSPIAIVWFALPLSPKKTKIKNSKWEFVTIWNWLLLQKKKKRKKKEKEKRPFIDSLKKLRIAWDPCSAIWIGGNSNGLSLTSKIRILLREASSWGRTLWKVKFKVIRKKIWVFF